MRKRILLVAGTRPEAIKMAPIILRLRDEPELFETQVCATGQHRDMLDSVFGLFGIRPQIDLDLMQPDQSLNGIAAGVFGRFDRVLLESAPEWMLVQGDTTTAMAASLAAFHRGIKVGHVEAGLRTDDLRNPFPEEMNRRVVDLVSTAHFAPTARNAAALRGEGVAAEQIHVTGNTIVDALHWIAAHGDPPAEDRRLVLVTVHRRETFGEPMRRIFRAIHRLARRFPELRFVFPVHPNPRVREAAQALQDVANIELVEPADYRQFVAWMRACRVILTDSGGVQEEAPTFGKPTLVLRDVTERPEGIEAGVAMLVGTDEDLIFRTAERLLQDDETRFRMARKGSPHGDGRAADRIARILTDRSASAFDADPDSHGTTAST